MRDDTTQKLFEAVYANPLDDAPRLVLADHLQELGDPRGEFIAVQCAPQNEKTKKRANALLRKNWRKWLGDLAPMIRLAANAQKPLFRRGFLAAATVKGSAAATSPAWATLEELWFYGDALHPSMRHVRAMHHPPLDTLLDEKNSPWLVEDLELTVRNLDFAADFAKTKQLPALRRLRVHDHADWVLESRLASKLEVLRVEPQGASGRGGGAPRAAEFLDAARKLPALKTLIFDLTFLGESCAWIHEGTLTIPRDFRAGTFVPGARACDQASFDAGFRTLLRDVPLRELVIGAEVDADARAAILAIAKPSSLGRIVVNGESHECAAVRRATPEPQPMKDASDVAFAPDGSLYCAVGSSVVGSGSSWPCEWRVDALAVSEKHVAAGFSCFVRVFDRTGKSSRRLGLMVNGVRALAFSPDGKMLAAGGDNNTLTFVDPFTATAQKAQKLHKSSIWNVRFSPNGKLVATCSSDHTIRIVDVAKRRTIRQIATHENVVTDVIVTSDSIYASSHDGTVRRFDTNGEQRAIYTRKKKNKDEFAGAWRMALTPKALAVAWYEGYLTLHDLGDLRVLREKKISTVLTRVVCSPDGRKLALVGDEGVKIVDADG